MGQEYLPHNEINKDYKIDLLSSERTLLAILVKRRVNKTPPTSGKHSGTTLNEIVKVQGGEQCTSQGSKDVKKVQKTQKREKGKPRTLIGRSLTTCKQLQSIIALFTEIHTLIPETGTHVSA